MEAAGRWRLKVEDRSQGNRSECRRMDSPGAQDLTREENVDRETRTFVAPCHQRAHDRRDDEIDERVPRSRAAEVEPVPAEEESERMDKRAGEEGERQNPESERTPRR